MPKVLRCGDLMPGCNAVIEGKDEAEVMAKGAGSGSRASQEKGRRSRSPSRSAMANELMLIVEDNPKNLKAAAS